MACPKFAPKNTHSHGSVPKPHYLPHPWTRPTYDAIRHPDTICHFFHNALDTPTDARTYVGYVRADRSSTGKFDDYRPLRYESDAA